jgi:hypothetical protein
MTTRGVNFRLPLGGQISAAVDKPDDLTLTARTWDDVWAACPELGVVPWLSVRFWDPTVYDNVMASWGQHPDMPERPAT